MRRQVKCFEEVLDKDISYTVMDAGLRVVELEAIVGTVGKCNELDNRFRYAKRRDRNEYNRRYRMMEAFKKYTFFPPIDLYRHRGEYYVVDGNRRVSTALEMGVVYIDAHVTEYINPQDFMVTAGALHRRRFEQATGIWNIVLTHEQGFEYLLKEVETYTKGVFTASDHGSWYTHVFLPRCNIIKKSILPTRYAEVRTGDIYVLIGEFYQKYMDGLPAQIDYNTIISGFLFAHGLPPRRGFNSRVYRLLSHVYAQSAMSIYRWTDTESSHIV
jgi:hypothetical protein